MKALLFDFSIPRLLMCKAFSGITDSVVYGTLSGLSLANVPDPALPGSDWVRLEVMLCGVCGSDIAGLTFKTSPVLEPFLSMPAVLGHEILARVVEIGSGVSKVRLGDRVIVDPTISCHVRGHAAEALCPSCTLGQPTTCARAGEAGGPSPTGVPLARGLLLGANSHLPGGFGERMVAHESQLYRVPDGIDDELAVLTEPLSIGVHAVLQAKPDSESHALVIGSGPIALGTIWALRALGHKGPITAQTKRSREATLATALGASETVQPGEAAERALLSTGATAHKPIVGANVYAGGGFPVVFDCVGTRDSLDQSLRFVAARGNIILLGCAGEIGNIDLTFLWAREVRFSGFLGYGQENWLGERLHTFEVTQRLMETTMAPLGSMVSHRFPLASYKDALHTAMHRRKSGALKVVLAPN